MSDDIPRLPLAEKASIASSADNIAITIAAKTFEKISTIARATWLRGGFSQLI